jgi:hypothetical protein
MMVTITMIIRMITGRGTTLRTLTPSGDCDASQKTYSADADGHAV